MSSTPCKIIFVALIISFFSHSTAEAQSVSGYVRYQTVSNGWMPLKNSRIRIETYLPTQTYELYTDNNGYYYQGFISTPNQIVTRVFFQNSKIDLRGALTTRSTFKSIVNIGGIGPSPCPPPSVPPIPCDFGGTNYFTINLDFEATEDQSRFSKIFTLANQAADFSVASGYTPGICVVKYPMETSIINQIDLRDFTNDLQSFFWPFETISSTSTGFQVVASILAPIVSLASFFGYTGEVTDNAIYITDDIVNGSGTTVYHEYGHFLMKQKRSDWPVSKTEYVNNDVPITHNSGNSQQNSRQAYIEGWANYYEMAVVGWLSNPSNPYSVSKYYVGHVSNGYNHELTVGNAFFDFYDPANDENFQTTYANISNVMGEKQNIMSEFISALAHKSYITDVQRNAGIGLMNLNSNKMNPLTSYGNATMYVKNDFNGGIVNINNSDVNTSALGGTFSTTELWMSTYRTLKAKEQMYDNYQRLFKHTRPNNPTDTWTTENNDKKNFNETWGVYTDALTFSGNFDRACNITFAKYGFDAGSTFENNTTAYRSETPLSLSVPDITQNGITYKFLSWSDGSTANPRPVTVSQHESFTANYKGHLFSGSSNATTNTNQRKIAQTLDGTYFMVYESQNRIWMTRSSDGTSWTNEFEVSAGASYNIKKSPSIFANENGNNVVIVWHGTGNDNNNIYLREYNKGTNSWSSIHEFPWFESTPGFDAMPVVSRRDNYYDGNVMSTCVVWREPSGLAVVSKSGGNWSSVTYIPTTNGNSIFPSITRIYSNRYGICWLNGDAERIEYTQAIHNYSTNGLQFDQNPTYISPSGWTMNQRPSIAVNGDWTLIITWQSFSNVVEGQSVHIREKLVGNNYWDQTITSFSSSSASGAKPIVGTFIDLSSYYILWEVDGSIYSTRGLGSTWTTPSILASGSSGGTNISAINRSKTSLREIWKKPNGQIAVHNSGLSKTSNVEKFVSYRLNKHALTYLDSIPELAEKGYKGMIAFEIAGLSHQSNYVKSQREQDKLRSENISVQSNNEVLKLAGAYYAKGLKVPDNARLNEISNLLTVNIRDANTDAIVKEVWSVPLSKLATRTNKTDGQYREINIPLTGLKDKDVYLDVSFAGNTKPIFVDDYYMLSKEDERMKKFFEEDVVKIPTQYALHQNYPNPFNPSTTIQFDLVEPQNVILKVYNSVGQEMKTIANDYYAEGSHEVTFDASSFSSGAYFYRIVAGKFTATKSFLLVK